MKRTVLILLVLSSLILALPALSFAQDNNIHIKVNGEVVNLDASPFISNNKTYIPLRGVVEKLGAKVAWNNHTKEIIVYKGRTVMVLTLNNFWTIINEKEVNVDAKPIIVNSKAFIPLRLISENLGATVTWDQPTRTISIVQNPVDDSNKSLVPLYYLKYRIMSTTDVYPTGHGAIIWDPLLLYYPESEEGDRLKELESEYSLTKDQIVAAKVCIENDKLHLIDGSGSEYILEMDEAMLKELESKLASEIDELKNFEENILKTVSTL